jgi:transcriptional regulator NrdR family protein
VNQPIEIKPGEVRCPRCFAKDVVLSLPRGILDAIMRKTGRVPRHCRACGRRFYAADLALKQTPQTESKV